MPDEAISSQMGIASSQRTLLAMTQKEINYVWWYSPKRILFG